MRTRSQIIIVHLILSMMAISCNSRKQAFTAGEVYKSDDIVITRIAENSFVHTSYLQTESFGNVPCNGLIVRDGEEVIIFDTPVDDKSSEELINWIAENLKCKINAIVPTHFHDDCLGGLQAFHKQNIPSHANRRTIELATKNNFAIPQRSFDDSLKLKVGKQEVTLRFFGEGHTRDNVVAYFPDEDVLFGGCLIKEMDAAKGYLGDANEAQWSATVEKVKSAYPDVKIVVPGHGKHGDAGLLDYTIKLFRN